MIWTISKLVLSAGLIAFSSWLAEKKPALAGLLLALPISTLLALGFNHAEFQSPEKSVAFARGIFWGIPVSLLFFVPFLFAERLGLGFWQMYLSGLGLVLVGFFIHQHFLA